MVQLSFEDGMKMVKHWPLATRRNGEHKVKNTIIFSVQKSGLGFED